MMGTAMNLIWVIKTYLQLSASDTLTTAMVAATMMAAAGSRSSLVGGGIVFSTIKWIAHV